MRLRTKIALAWLGLVLGGCPQGPAAGPASATASPTGAGPEGAASVGSSDSTRWAFVMGSDGSRAGGRDDERPRAVRQVAPFALDTHEVTNADYAAFLADPAARDHHLCHPEEPADKDHTPGLPTTQEQEELEVPPDPFRGEDRAQHPVVLVDWFDAYAYAAWKGRRLPSEDEWECAARGEAGRTWPWGEEPPQGPPCRANGWFLGDGYPFTAPVGSFPEGATPEGLQDLAGNVWEWTASPYLAYEGAPEDTPSDPDLLVLRGGAWSSADRLLLRGAVRLARPRTSRSASIGFRTAGAPAQAAR